jgi:hypothetical protein
MKYEREREKKFVLSDITMALAIMLLRDYAGLSNYSDLRGTSTDTFWDQPGVDFVRLRKNTNELSIKITDKSTIEDRVEENILVADYNTAFRFACATFGQPKGVVEKDYYVLDNFECTFSLYRVTGLDQLFLEIEAPTMSQVNRAQKDLERIFHMKQEMRSLYQIVFGRKEAA